MTCDNCGQKKACVSPFGVININDDIVPAEYLCCLCLEGAKCETCYDGPEKDDWSGRGIHEVYADAWRSRP